MAKGGFRDSVSSEEDDQMYAALAVGLVCVVIGVPIWWHTTTVYQADIPYSDIAALQHNKIHLKTEVIFVALDPALNKKQELRSIKASLTQLSDKEDREAEGDIRVGYSFTARQAYQEEQRLLTAAASLEEYEAELEKELVLDDVGRYRVYALPPSSPLAPPRLLLGSRRALFCQLQPGDVEKGLADVITLLRHSVVDEAALYTKSGREGMRAVQSHPSYGVTFSLVNPAPHLLQADWDIEHALNTHITPFATKIKPFTDLQIKSQVLLYSNFHVRPTKRGDQHVLSVAQLPHVITPLEARLGSHVTNSPQLNFLLYVSPPQHSPLVLHDANDEPVASNGFLSPRWGGLVVYNPPAGNSTPPAQHTVELQPALVTFGSQLRLLLSIVSLKPSEVGDIMTPDASFITDTELDHWLRRRLQENTARASSTLTSLADLLGKIRNMVISDAIGEQVSQAVSSLRESAEHASAGDLKQAFLTSQTALSCAERAFFDASLLELLYFPEDQKFAIYIPLFLPISLPVLLSLQKAFSWLKKRRSSCKLKTC